MAKNQGWKVLLMPERGCSLLIKLYGGIFMFSSNLLDKLSFDTKYDIVNKGKACQGTKRSLSHIVVQDDIH
jgi:hypoxanthine-guanine phosphoribosyltransferase